MLFGRVGKVSGLTNYHFSDRAKRWVNVVLSFETDTLAGSKYADKRRRLLRSFLMQCRGRLEPTLLGLPHTGRRRVPGLRRGEVAELMGVSVDWYRRFECGRSVQVSLQFLSRLIVVLKLTDREVLALYWLAIPEVFRAERGSARQEPASRSGFSTDSPIEPWRYVAS